MAEPRYLTCYRWFRQQGWEFYDKPFPEMIIMRKNNNSCADSPSWEYITILPDGKVVSGKERTDG